MTGHSLPPEKRHCVNGIIRCVEFGDSLRQASKLDLDYSFCLFFLDITNYHRYTMHAAGFGDIGLRG